MVWRPAASPSHRSLQKCGIFGYSSRLLSLNLYFNTVSRRFVWTLKFEKTALKHNKHEIFMVNITYIFIIIKLFFSFIKEIHLCEETQCKVHVKFKKIKQIFKETACFFQLREYKEHLFLLSGVHPKKRLELCNQMQFQNTIQSQVSTEKSFT